MPSDSIGERLEVAFEDERGRYHRQTLISWWDQERLAAASVLVVGAGALGNELVKNLALVGVRRIRVADLDVIESSNLSRCVFFRPGDEGRAKADVVAERARELNPDVEVEALIGDLRLTTGLGIFHDVDIVLCGLDNREARLFVNQACWKTTTPWIDGAIEGLMGVVRLFVPPDSACYECTMSERDHELINARRTCALLSREDILEGKVPTTATSASVVAAMQVQEAVKVLHAERLGPPAYSLAGAGFQFVGLTHDSYVVRYSRRDDCLSHDTYDLAGVEWVDESKTFRELLARAQAVLGEDAIVELEHEIVVSATCGSCGHHQDIGRPVVALSSGSGWCPRCGDPWRLELAHSVDANSPLLDGRPSDFGVPPHDVVVGRSGFNRTFFRLTGGVGGVKAAA